MVRRLLAFLMVCCVCLGPVAKAADLPSWTPKQKSSLKKAADKPKVAVAKPKPAASKPKKIAAIPVPVTSPAVDDVPANDEIDMIWVLDPLVANADGAKTEDSASIEGNLIVVEPGYVSLPYMVIELTGHIIKTPQTTARLDVRIGTTSRTVSWKPDDVQSGKFRIELNAPMKEGKLPAYFPVSALAFVTKEGKEGAAMVSLDKIVVRVGKISVATSQ